MCNVAFAVYNSRLRPILLDSVSMSTKLTSICLWAIAVIPSDAIARIPQAQAENGHQVGAIPVASAKLVPAAATVSIRTAAGITFSSMEEDATSHANRSVTVERRSGCRYSAAHPEQSTHAQSGTHEKCAPHEQSGRVSLYVDFH